MIYIHNIYINVLIKKFIFLPFPNQNISRLRVVIFLLIFSYLTRPERKRDMIWLYQIHDGNEETKMANRKKKDQEVKKKLAKIQKTKIKINARKKKKKLSNGRP